MRHRRLSTTHTRGGSESGYLVALLFNHAAGLHAKAKSLWMRSRIMKKGLIMPATAPDSDACAADPAFALIAEKLAADVAHCAAIDAQDKVELDHGFDYAAWLKASTSHAE